MKRTTLLLTFAVIALLAIPLASLASPPKSDHAVLNHHHAAREAWGLRLRT